MVIEEKLVAYLEVAQQRWEQDYKIRMYTPYCFTVVKAKPRDEMEWYWSRLVFLFFNFSDWRVCVSIEFWFSTQSSIARIPFKWTSTPQPIDFSGVLKTEILKWAMCYIFPDQWFTHASSLSIQNHSICWGLRGVPNITTLS